MKGVETQDILLNVLPGIIGRSDRAEYPLYETGISRRHARVFQNTGKLCIEDLASTNGTYYNGRRISVGEQVFFGRGEPVSAWSDILRCGKGEKILGK